MKAVRPERDALEIRFPRVLGYRVELPTERLTANFSADSTLELTPDLVGATETQNSGIIGEGSDLNIVHTADVAAPIKSWGPQETIASTAEKHFTEPPTPLEVGIDNNVDVRGTRHDDALRSLERFLDEACANASVPTTATRSPASVRLVRPGHAPLGPCKRSGTARYVHGAASLSRRDRPGATKSSR